MASDWFDVAGLRTVITGGTAGIGRAVAAHLAGERARVVIMGRRSEGTAIAEDVGASFVQVDVADDDSVRVAMESAAAQLDGGIDVLVLNAGIDEVVGTVERADLEMFRRVVDVNLGGVARGLRYGVAYMASGGSVIVTSSPSGRISVPELGAYSASKAAVDSLVRTAALELAGRGIRVNAVLPGVVETEMNEGATGDGVWITALTASGVLRRPDEVAPVYQFLASDASRTLTGATLQADDGVTAGISTRVLELLRKGP